MVPVALAVWICTGAGAMSGAGTRMEELSGTGLLPAPRASERIDALYDEVDGLFTRCDRLTGRGTASVARLPRN